MVDKEWQGDPLSSRIRRVLYLSATPQDDDEEDADEPSHGLHEIFPRVNETVLRKIAEAQMILYGVGSLYTSICPCLIVPGIGQAIQQRRVPKILMLNGSYDRETSGMKASDVVLAITNALDQSFKRGHSHRTIQQPPSQYVTLLLAPQGGDIPVPITNFSPQAPTHVVF